MTTDFRSETFELSTDSHLADRAKLGSAPAFDELVRRHADIAVATAMVVTGDAQAAVPAGARAFTDVLDQMATGGYSIEDPYLPGLIRSSRELALADPEADPALRERMDNRLPELARSTRWLTTAVALDAEDLALALDIEDPSVPGILTWTDELVADHADAVDTVLGGVSVLVPTTFAMEARSIWRRWLATAGVEATVGATGGAVAIESVASRILRGAAVVLIVAGAIGAITGIARRGDDGGGTTRIAQRAAAEQPKDRSQRATSGADGTDTSGAEQALANTDLGSTTPMVVSTTPMVVTPAGNAQDVRVNSGSATSTSTSTTGPRSSPPQRGKAPATPSATRTPTSATRPTTRATTPTMPATPPASTPAPTSPPVTPPPAPTSPPAATAPPVEPPPVAPPPITVPPLLAPVVGPVTSGLGALLGGSR